MQEVVQVGEIEMVFLVAFEDLLEVAFEVGLEALLVRGPLPGNQPLQLAIGQNRVVEEGVVEIPLDLLWGKTHAPSRC